MSLSQMREEHATPKHNPRPLMIGTLAPPASAVVRARVQPAIGPAFDVSRCTGRELAAVYAQAVEREPLLVDTARHESPADDYAIVERFLTLFEAEHGTPFKIGQ